MEKHVFQIQFDDRCPTLEEIRDDPQYGVTQEVRDWINLVMSDSELSECLIEGMPGDDDFIWYEQPHGTISCMEIPDRYCSECGFITSNGRTLNISCPDSVAGILKNYSLSSLEDSPARLSRLISTIEAALHANGIDISLQPGDTFHPPVWKDPLFLEREVTLVQGCDLVVNERLANKLRHANLSGVELCPLQMKNRFFPDCKKQFFWTLARPTLWKSNFILEEQGIPCRLCESCQQVRYHYEDRDVDQGIKMKIMYSGWRKKRVLPRRYVSDAAWFSSIVYRGPIDHILLKPEAMDLFHDVDLSFAKITKIEIID